jgi:alkanesulfonate monooxygenase SsuD/methylene tetrahydromethanopterin reductase-like flavin-dependent oxidoreductase (luciferase family)
MIKEKLRYGVAVPNWGLGSNPGAIGELARAAEVANWDGYFTWDALLVGEAPPPTYDPFLSLALAAVATTHIRIGTCILVAPRYAPHLLAMRMANLDVLSGGRLIMGVGLGDKAATFATFGEPGSARNRAEKLDEMLDIVHRLWTGERVSHAGKYFTVDGFTLNPVPIQKPRIPIWVGGDSPGALARAARWDGWIGPDADPFTATIAGLTAVWTSISEQRSPPAAFDLAWAGPIGTAPGQRPEDMEDAGATWLISPATGDRDRVTRQVAEGPKR